MDITSALATMNFFVPKIIFWIIFLIFVVVGYFFVKDMFPYESRYKLNYVLVFSAMTAIYFGYIEKILIYKSGAIKCILYTEKEIRGGLDPCMFVEWYGSNIFIYGLFILLVISTFLILRYIHNKYYFEH